MPIITLKDGLPRYARNDDGVLSLTIVQDDDMHVMVAMSGGVDSAVAAAICRDKYLTVTGATMHLFDSDFNVDNRAQVQTRSKWIAASHRGVLGAPRNDVRSCCSLEDVEDAKAVCALLGIKHYSFNYKAEFMDRVIMPFARTYEQAATPNPCLNCNKYLKFDILLQRALETGHSKLATGHYAISRQEPDGYFHLYKSVDNTKDQSYVLYFLDQATLPHLLFPLGEQTKEQTRLQAEQLGLKVANKADSQDICFVQNRHFSEVLTELLPQSPALQPGEIHNVKGEVIGQHHGIAHYTIGQRKGLGVASKSPLFVKEIDAAKNAIVLAEIDELQVESVQANQVSEIYPGALTSLKPSDPIQAKFRYNTPEVEGSVKLFSLESDLLEVKFVEPQVSIAPGQALVIYRGDEVLGGGTIVK